MARKKRQKATSVPVETRSGITDPEQWFVDYVRRGLHATPATALSIPAFWACVNVVASDVAMLPLRPVEIDKDTRRPQTGHPTYRLVHSAPNPEAIKQSVFETWILHALTFPAGYLEIQRDALGRPAHLWNLDPRGVQERRDSAGALYYEVQGAQGGWTRVDPANLLVLHGVGFSGLVGYALSRLSEDALLAHLGALRVNAALFENGTIPSGFLTHPNHLKPDAFERLKQSFAERHAGVQNAWKPMILEEGLKFEKSAFSPADAQLIEALRLGVENVARLFRVPLYKIQHMVGTTFASVDALAVDYLQTLLPWMVRIEQELNRKLLAPHEVGRIEYKHSARGLLRGDLKTQSAYYKEMLTCGVFCINDVRALEDLPPIEGGDVHFVPSTMLALKAAGDPGRILGPPAQPTDGSAARLRLAHLPLVQAAIDRLRRVEDDKIARARRREDDLGAWLTGFLDTHRTVAAATLGDPLEAYARVCWAARSSQSMPEPVEASVHQAIQSATDLHLRLLTSTLSGWPAPDSCQSAQLLLERIESCLTALPELA